MRLFLIAVSLLVWWGCEPYAEEPVDPGSPGLTVSGEGWPDAVSPLAPQLILHAGSGLVPGGSLSVALPDGRLLAAVAGYDQWRQELLVTLPTLPALAPCVLVVSNMPGSDGSVHHCRTNFRTGPLPVVPPPAVLANWPAAAATDVPTAGVELKFVFSRAVQRGCLSLCLYGAGAYRYLAPDDSGSGTSATYTIGGALAPDSFYQVLLGGVRGTDGVFGTGTQFSFRTAAAAVTNEPVLRLCFSELCWQLAADTPAAEFIELYNPTPYPVDLAASGVRLYRNTGSGWTLVCDFANPEHFSAPPAGRISGYGYYLLANRDAGLSADAQVLAGRLTMSGNDAFALTRGGTPGGGRTLDAASFSPAIGDGSMTIVKPAIGESCERKACRDATAQDMGPSGIYRLCGNGYAGGIPGDDFLLRQQPEPQGCGSGLEIPR